MHESINGENSWNHPASISIFKLQLNIYKYSNLFQRREKVTLPYTVNHPRKEYWFSNQLTWDHERCQDVFLHLVSWLQRGSPGAEQLWQKSKTKFWELQEPVWYDRQDSKPSWGNVTLDGVGMVMKLRSPLNHWSGGIWTEVSSGDFHSKYWTF